MKPPYMVQQCGVGASRLVREALEKWPLVSIKFPACFSSYTGIETYFAANMVDGGGLACAYGCLGHSDCQVACPFDAIRMVEGLPVINQ